METKESKKNNSVEERIKIPSSGFSIILPERWDRQDLFGQIVVYAPGEGYRARISINDNDDNEEDWESPQKLLENCKLAQSFIFKNWEWNKIEETTNSTFSGYQITWTGELKRTNNQIVKIKGIIVAVPHKKRGAVVTYMATEESFIIFENEFWQTVDSIAWLLVPKTKN